jgi:hypothetical protein
VRYSELFRGRNRVGRGWKRKYCKVQKQILVGGTEENCEELQPRQPSPEFRYDTWISEFETVFDARAPLPKEPKRTGAAFIC